ncbi:MAG: hypothetical protein ACKOCN_13615 [Planctomycetaceae bacterium]
MRQFIGMLAAIALTALCWGIYGPVIHEGQTLMASRLRPFMCVGAAYFLIAVLVPALLLVRRGEKGTWTMKGVLWSLLAGACGALGALGVILALAAGGKPIYVMPLVFGGAPVVNTLLSAFLNRAFGQLKAAFLAGLLLVITGAVTVLVFKPQPAVHAPAAAAAKESEASSAETEPSVAPTGDTAVEAASKVIEKRTERFLEVLLAVAMTVLCWGAYGPVLHKGQMAMQGSRLRPLLCIGLAYFLIAVLVPLGLLGPLGDSGNWSVGGVLWGLGGGSLGALGALGTILAFNLGGKPFTVMPVVFGCAPVINTLTSSLLQGTSLANLSPFFLAGMLIVGVGAATVLAFGPRGHAPAKS